MTFDPRSERHLATLIPEAQTAARQLLAAAQAAMAPHGLIVRIISGTRTYAEQDELYAQGRTRPGSRVTNARGGFSNHNFGIAWDIGLFDTTTNLYISESPHYRTCGAIGRAHGLEWGGDWKSIVDEPHFQLKTGLTLAEMRDRREKGLPLTK